MLENQCIFGLDPDAKYLRVKLTGPETANATAKIALKSRARKHTTVADMQVIAVEAEFAEEKMRTRNWLLLLLATRLTLSWHKQTWKTV